MNKRTLINGLIFFALGIGVSYFFLGNPAPSPSGEIGSMNGENGAETKPLYWQAPMDPNFRSDTPGDSPMGMELVPVYAEPAGMSADASIVTISSAVINNIGVRTGRVIRGDLFRRINTVAYINYDESLISHVHLRTEGWIERLLIDSIGDRVKKGELLLELYSPELVNAQSEFIQVLGTKQKRLISASRDRLRALGIAQSRIKELEKSGKVEQLVKTFSPQNGVVSELKVRDGMYVKPANEILSLADLKRVWVLADVFESQADWVKIGQDAVVTLPYLPGREWKGKVSYIYPSLDPKTRSLKVRLQFDNPGEDLKPEMYADITIFAKPKKNTLSVPREAVIITGKSTKVVKSLGNGRFKPVEVKVGIETDDRMEIISGLEEGEEIVTSAQFLIDSESSLRGGFQRINDPATDETMPAGKATNDQETMAP